MVYSTAAPNAFVPGTSPPRRTSRLLRQNESCKALNLVNAIDAERAPVVDLRRVRIAIPSDDFWQQEPIDPGVAAVVGEALAKLAEGLVIARNLFIAPRLGAPALNIPAGLSNGLPVGLQLDALPGHDSELLGLRIAVERVFGRIPAPRVAQR